MVPLDHIPSVIALDRAATIDIGVKQVMKIRNAYDRDISSNIVRFTLRFLLVI